MKIANSREILSKSLKECFSGKVAGPQSPTLSKDKKAPLQIFFNWFIYLLRTTAYQWKLQGKNMNFEIMLLEVYRSSFSAAAACTFNWPMIDFLRNKDEPLEYTAPAFKCDQEKRKRNMESTVWKFTMESVVHSIWKVYGNYDMSLLIPE